MWTKENIPDQTGKVAIVTGANTGIGYETALALYEKGAHVIVASRDATKAQYAIDRMKASGGNGSLEIGTLDLASMKATKAFADDFKSKYQYLDLLINNAGVMTPHASKTNDGFELHFGVNFIGHFVLTAHLLPLVQASRAGRIVTVSSAGSTLVSEIDFDNLKMEKGYDANKAYFISKLAGIQFSYELDRRLKRINSPVISTAAHPGVSHTDLQRHIPADELKTAFQRFAAVSEPWQAALPSLYAATAESVTGGDYYGPDGENEHSGYPAPSKRLTGAEQDEQQAKKLWAYTEDQVGHLFALSQQQ